MREIALDTETTGISVQEGHRVIEIGAVELVNHFRTGRVFHVYVNPEREISEGAFKVHGISREFLADKPVFKEVALELLEFIGDSRLVIHNAQFDMGFLNHHLAQHGHPQIANNSERVFDTLTYARKKYPGAKNNLDALCARFNISTVAREKHGALLDAELLADVYAEMIGAGSNQRNLMFLGAVAQKAADEERVTTNMARPYRPARVFDIAAEELAAHEKLISKIKDAIWKKIA